MEQEKEDGDGERDGERNGEELIKLSNVNH